MPNVNRDLGAGTIQHYTQIPHTLPMTRPAHYRPEFANQAFHACRLGADNAGLARIGGINFSAVSKEQIFQRPHQHLLRESRESRWGIPVTVHLIRLRAEVSVRACRA